jgi:hypothetical protein
MIASFIPTETCSICSSAEHPASSRAQAQAAAAAAAEQQQQQQNRTGQRLGVEVVIQGHQADAEFAKQVQVIGNRYEIGKSQRP